MTSLIQKIFGRGKKETERRIAELDAQGRKETDEAEAEIASAQISDEEVRVAGDTFPPVNYCTNGRISANFVDGDRVVVYRPEEAPVLEDKSQKAYVIFRREFHYYGGRSNLMSDRIIGVSLTGRPQAGDICLQNAKDEREATIRKAMRVKVDCDLFEKYEMLRKQIRGGAK